MIFVQNLLCLCEGNDAAQKADMHVGRKQHHNLLIIFIIIFSFLLGNGFDGNMVFWDGFYGVRRIFLVS